jgi:hypothetical protein
LASSPIFFDDDDVLVLGLGELVDVVRSLVEHARDLVASADDDANNELRID